MSCHRRIVWRALIGAVAATTLYLGPAAAITTASAHVQASSTDAVRGGTALVTFQVPNESTTGAATTALTVDVTTVSAVQTEAKPGWTTKLDRDSGSGTVRSVTWTAAPDGGIPVDRIRGVPDIGEASRRRHGQLPGYPDLRRRGSGEVGPAAGDPAGLSRNIPRRRWSWPGARRRHPPRTRPRPALLRRPPPPRRRRSSPGRRPTTPPGFSVGPPYSSAPWVSVSH